MANVMYSKHIFRNFVAVLPLALAFLVMLPARADAAILSVDFTPDPLFKANNFLPADEVSGTVQVQNTDEGSHEVVTEAINVSDDDGFGSKLRLVIKDASNTTFFDSGFDSFLTSGVPTTLGTLAPAETKTFTYTVSFLDTNDNTYQGRTLGFDLCVGVAGGATSCGDTQISQETGGGGGSGDEGGLGGDGDAEVTIPGSGSGGGGGGGGGGGSTGSSSLQISGESVTSVDVINGTATIEWDTNLYATTQVIYGPASGTYILSLVLPYLPFFGYPSGTIENTTKVLHHSVLITGLTPGETYKYRVVSRASPPTTSFERQFTLLSGGPTGASGGAGGAGGGTFSGGTLAHNDVPGGGPRGVDTGGEVGESGSGAQTSDVDGNEVQGGTDTFFGTGSAGDGDTQETVAGKEGVELRNNLAAAWSGIPTWIRDNINCIAYAGLLLAVIYLLAMFIPWRHKEESGPVATDFLRQRKTPFLISTCILVSIAAFIFGWCLFWPFVIFSLVALTSSAVHHGRQ